MENEFKFELGSEVKDIITGFKGIIIGRSDWLTGCNTYGILPKCKDNKSTDSAWFDETRIKLLSGKPIKLGDEVKEEDNGGPQETPQQTNR